MKKSRMNLRTPSLTVIPKNTLSKNTLTGFVQSSDNLLDTTTADLTTARPE